MRLLRHLTVQVIIAITLGVALGVAAPDVARQMRPLGDVFINAIKLVTTPVVFVTVVLGIAGMRDLRAVGRIGLKALVYFEVLTTVALLIGIVVINVTKPGVGFDLGGLAPADASRYVAEGEALRWVDFLTHIVPSSAVDAFARGDVLQVVFVALLFGIAVALTGAAAEPLIGGIDRLAKVIFTVVGLVIRAAPIGAFGAMAATVGTFGLKSLLPLGRLMLDVYLTMFVFVFGVLWLVARWSGFSLWRFLRVIKDEILLVFGTSSSEAALPKLLEKLERYGCAKPIVGLVLPAGYSFNLDGTAIYLSMAALFLAQVYRIDLSVGQQLTLLGVLMITSKGAAGVTGSGFIVLASTLAALRVVPVEGVALLLGVDRFMSEARAIVNVIGNGVATVVIARSEGAFDEAAAARLESA